MLVTLAENCTLPVDLPPALTFDCFVPGVGTCEATVDVSAEEILVVQVLRDGQPLSGLYEDPAVVEQAGDVCAVFERALTTQQRDAQGCRDDPADLKTLDAIATLAQCEADAYAAWCALPAPMTHRHPVEEPGDPEHEYTTSQVMVQSFVDDVLVSRAQKLAQAAAKKRQAEWEHEHRQRLVEERAADALDVAIHEAKAGGR